MHYSAIILLGYATRVKITLSKEGISLFSFEKNAFHSLQKSECPIFKMVVNLISFGNYKMAD